ncbi:AMP-binding protein [Metabacillus fastidiosus]|uniref:AMP-binding protein n=1 Tax=Metabacillus fastidiosus TaxID=1458 RepID=UPI002DB5C14F|nr:AMP-binding protein [Metabacillus fastidiosus]MEC2077303.1 AMP-binding protein [Metabacillus fastidiosus]
MGFWDIADSEREAVVLDNQSYTYEQFNKSISECQKVLESDKKQLVLILCENSYGVLVTYVAALRSNHAVMLLSSDLNNELLNNVIDTYQPAWVYGSLNSTDYEKTDQFLWKRKFFMDVNIHSELAILLSTSGTTGSRKFARLSYRNIQSNAEAIGEYLQMTSDERGIVNLPISYSYGMSIVNSHLATGATLLLTDNTVMEKSFWEFLNKKKATSFAGVPFTYQMLYRVGFLKMELPHLRMFTQAGGRLNEKFARLFGEYAANHNKHFYIMYGQTEASPRMSYIPPSQLLKKTDSIGIPIPGGSFEIDSETDELIYKGTNVMMGYAESLADLAKGDGLQGVLHTGDTARVDEDGFYSITGRMKRFLKLFGLRINLDEVEKRLESSIQSTVACTGNDDRLIVVIESENVKQAVHDCLDSIYKLHKSAFRIHILESIPRLSNGKTDYKAIKEELI